MGSHIAEGLVARGHRVKCLVRRTSNRQWLRNCDVEYCLGDLDDVVAVRDSVKGVDAVIHAAGVLRALRREDYYAINQLATGNLARSVLEVNPALHKFIYLSSQAAMGPSSGPYPKPLTEPENPVSDYGRSKLAGEKELHVLNGRVPYTVLRPSSVYGPRDRDIFIFFSLVHRRLRPLTLRRRLIQLAYVGDIVKAVMTSLTDPATNGKTYFLADETVYSWEDVGRTIADAVGRSTMPLPLPDMAFRTASFISESIARLRGTPAVLNRQKIDEMLTPYWVGDTFPARKELHLDFTNLKIGAKITYLWYKNNNWF